MNNGSEKIIIFDTTLRDGGVSLNPALGLEEKLEIARQLVKLGVDVLEIGFPGSSQEDFEIVMRASQEIPDVTIAALAYARIKDIDYAWKALKPASRPRLHLFLSVSDDYLKQIFRSNREQGLEIARATVAHAKKYCHDVEFSAHDATRADPDYLCQVIEVAIEAGATTISIPDTIGCTSTDDFEQLITTVMSRVPNISQAVVSVHCHNNMGLAVANSLAAVKNGARQIECTVNGIGERMGNASMQEIVAAFNNGDLSGFRTDIDQSHMERVGALVGQHIQAMV